MARPCNAWGDFFFPTSSSFQVAPVHLLHGLQRRVHLPPAGGLRGLVPGPAQEGAQEEAGGAEEGEGEEEEGGGGARVGDGRRGDGRAGVGVGVGVRGAGPGGGGGGGQGEAVGEMRVNGCVNAIGEKKTLFLNGSLFCVD